MIRGEAYNGKARLFGHDYMTQYQPVPGPDGKTIAVLFVGFDFTEQLASVIRGLQALRFGESGHALLLDVSAGPNKGKLLVHDTPEGKNVLSDAAASPLKALTEQAEGILETKLEGRDRLVGFAECKPWNWVVAD